MGIAIKVTDLDFSNNNLGQVTFLAGRVESISIDGPSTISSNTTSVEYSIVYNPANTEETDVEWSIVEGSEIASINSYGVLTIDMNRSAQSIVIRATSVYNSLISATKTIAVEEHVSFYEEHNIVSVTGSWGTDKKFKVYTSTDTYYNKIYGWYDTVEGTTTKCLTAVSDNNYTIYVAPGYKVRVCYATGNDLTEISRDSQWKGSATVETVIDLSSYLPSTGGGFALNMAAYGSAAQTVDVTFVLNESNIDTYFHIEHN